MTFFSIFMVERFYVYAMSNKNNRFKMLLFTVNACIFCWKHIPTLCFVWLRAMHLHWKLKLSKKYWPKSFIFLVLKCLKTTKWVEALPPDPRLIMYLLLRHNFLFIFLRNTVYAFLMRAIEHFVEFIAHTEFMFAVKFWRNSVLSSEKELFCLNP